MSEVHNPATAQALNLSTKLSFGIGQIAEGVKTCAFGTYLLFYYNQVLGLSGDLAGLAIFIALVFDAVTDPIAGSVSDRWQSPLGRRHQSRRTRSTETDSILVPMAPVPHSQKAHL